MQAQKKVKQVADMVGKKIVAISKGPKGQVVFEENRKRLEKFSKFSSHLEENLNEGVNDPSIFKAVFLAGGPGSGKSFIVGRTALTALGMKVVNSDDIFEKALKDAGLDAKNPDDIFSPRGQEIRGVSVKKTKNKEKMYIDGRLGLVIDGTGKDVKKITDHKKELEDLGYETAMIFVNTDLETALERNRKRSRSLPDNEVEKMWKRVQDNISTYKTVFGSNAFFEVDNFRRCKF